MIRTNFALGFILVLSFFYACTPSVNQKIYQAGSPALTIFQDTLPFELREGFMVVRARLNDRTMPLDFIWDSGAPVSTISQATREYLGLPKSIKPGTLARLDSLRLSNVSFPSVPVEIIDYDGYAAPKCIAEAGVIGANLIRHCNWYIDFDQQLIIFSDKAQQAQVATPSHTLDFKTTALGQPELKVVTDITGKNKAIAGIGQSGGLCIEAPKLPDAGQMAYDQGIINRFAHTIDTTVIFPDTQVGIGPLSWQGLLTVQRNHASRLGNDLWAQYNVALNFETETISLIARTQAPPPIAPLPQLGWMPHFTPVSELTVGFIIVGSPAWEAGLRMGDVIDQIDRRAAPGWYNDYCAYLSSVQSQFAVPQQMQVFKNGSKQPLNLKVEGTREKP
ncbi:MAG: aspartyl protease family protein [Phaeodactylibacter sp.]|uniref:PDZ domain-containing protein n=1 Tax=Phaeodactylibacter sp. TaxID=1940289 RepID=UPI0032EADCBC